MGGMVGDSLIAGDLAEEGGGGSLADLTAPAPARGSGCSCA